MLDGLELFRRVAVCRRRVGRRLPRMGVIVGVNHYGVVETVGVREQRATDEIEQEQGQHPDGQNRFPYFGMESRMSDGRCLHRHVAERRSNAVQCQRHGAQNAAQNYIIFQNKNFVVSLHPLLGD